MTPNATTSEAWRLGRRAAIEGWSIQPPSHLRKQVDKDDYENGWLAGKKEAEGLLQGHRPVLVGKRRAAPRVRLTGPEASCKLVWVDEAAGQAYDSAELALQGLKARVARDVELAAQLASQPPLKRRTEMSAA
ncbi:hypothetical protein [Acidovorax sp.]|uniref:hypothetical protein n=1 Tax=Acidovorax sp. TaxID=1872122 RepID=UPI00391F7213